MRDKRVSLTYMESRTANDNQRCIRQNQSTIVDYINLISDRNEIAFRTRKLTKYKKNWKATDNNRNKKNCSIANGETFAFRKSSHMATNGESLMLERERERERKENKNLKLKITTDRNELKKKRRENSISNLFHLFYCLYYYFLDSWPPQT